MYCTYSEDGLAHVIATGYAQALVSTIGDNLKRIRGERGQEEIADRMGVQKPQVSNWETGRYRDMALKTLFKLAIGYQCTVEEIIEGVNEKYSASRDQIRHGTGVQTPPHPQGVANVKTPARALADRLKRERSLAREIEDVAGQLHEIATELVEEAAAARRRTPARRRRSRKAS